MKRNLVLWLEPGEMHHRIVIRGYSAVSFVLTSFIFSPALVMELGPYKDWGNSFLGGIWTHDLLHRSLSNKARGEQIKHTIGNGTSYEIAMCHETRKGCCNLFVNGFQKQVSNIFSFSKCESLHRYHNWSTRDIAQMCSQIVLF